MKLRRVRNLAVVPGLACAAVVLTACGGGAATGDGPTEAQQKVIDAVQYSGGDREQYLYECAQEEGTLVWYTSSSSIEETIAGEFESAYPGISVEVFKETTALVQVLTEEEKAGRHRFDLYGDIHGNLDRTGEYFVTLNEAVTDGLRPELQGEYFVGTSGFIMGAAINTNLIDPDDAPRSYEDLADPQWRDKIAGGLDTTTPFTFGVAKAAHGEELMQELAANTRVQEGVSSAGVRDLIIAGEVPIGWGISSSYQKRNAIDQGAPFLWIPLSPMVATFTTYSISKNAPHPCAAALALDWLLDPETGQKLLLSDGSASPLADAPLLPFDVPGTDPDDWDIVYGTDPAIFEDAGFSSYREASTTWDDEFRRMFVG